MLSLLRFIAGRLFSALLTLFIITAVLYAIVMMTPPRTRVEIYIPDGANLARLNEAQYEQYIQHLILKYGLNDPYPVQYIRWVSNLIQGQMGFSPLLNTPVRDALVLRMPATFELTIYSLLLLIPMGLVFGAIAGWRKNRRPDYMFRAAAFVGASFPSFVLAIILIAIFYVGLHLLPPGRMGDVSSRIINSPGFVSYTGLLSVDGLLNGKISVSLDALQHLILPVFTLSLIHWATLGRMVRASTIEETQKEYTNAAKSRGLSDWRVLWKHVFPNLVSPALSSSALSAASLVTGVYVVERIFNIRGVSDVIVTGFRGIPDAPAALGYTLYNVVLVLLIMLVLDILRGIVDPRAREDWSPL